MKCPIKALPTVYNGITFRSRLEARWAVFMDYLHITYFYEPEAFDLDGLHYLPDFYLPNQDAFYEIKNPIFGGESVDIRKVQKLVMLSHKKAFVQYSPPKVPSDDFNEPGATLICTYQDEIGKWVLGEDDHYLWCQCPHCNRCELQFDGRSERIGCNCLKERYNYDSDKLILAYQASAAYRFENNGKGR